MARKRRRNPGRHSVATRLLAEVAIGITVYLAIKELRKLGLFGSKKKESVSGTSQKA